MRAFGAFLRGAFGLPKQDPESVRRVKEWSRSALRGPPGTVFAVNEIACMDPGCPGVETIILVMEPACGTRAVKILKALDQVTEQDVRDAFMA